MVKQIILLLVLLAGTASADTGVVVAGEATLQPQLVRQIEGWLKAKGHTVVPVPMPSDAIATLIDCFVIEDEACARGVIEKRARARSIIFARVDVQAGGDIERTVTVVAYWFEKGEKVGSARRFCERCNEATLRSTADDLMTQLEKTVPVPTGKLVLTTLPAGAAVAIDGKSLGDGPIDRELPQGTHQITVTRAGHRAETRTITIKAGETTSVEVTLAAAEEGRGASKLLPLATIGVGAALIVAGGVMLALDQDKGPDEPEFIRDTAPAGVAMGITGVLAVGGGVLWYRMTGSRESRPIAAVQGDGAYLGWQGRF